MEHIFTDANFDAEVLNSPLPVVVDFWAEWCSPCRMMSPILEEVAGEFAPQTIKVGTMNVDHNRRVPGEYGIMSIPTFLVFKNGRVVEQMVGAMPKVVFKEKLMKHV